MRKKIFVLLVSAGLLAAPAVFAATSTAPTQAAPAQATDGDTYFRMPMMNNGQGGYVGRGGFFADRDAGYGGYGMMGRSGYYGRGYGLLGAAHVVTMLLVWVLLILLICAVSMHIRRMKRRQQWWMENKMEGKPEGKGKEEVKA